MPVKIITIAGLCRPFELAVPEHNIRLASILMLEGSATVEPLHEDDLRYTFKYNRSIETQLQVEYQHFKTALSVSYSVKEMADYTWLQQTQAWRINYELSPGSEIPLPLESDSDSLECPWIVSSAMPVD